MTSRTHGRPAEILLVEDNPGDARLTIEAFREHGADHALHLVENGVEAMAYVRREGRHADARRPDLILLDLNIPRKDGREVLDELKSDPDLRSIPVAIVTTSMAERDVRGAWNSHANYYVNKTSNLEQFVSGLRAVVSLALDIRGGPNVDPPAPDPSPWRLGVPQDELDWRPT